MNQLLHAVVPFLLCCPFSPAGEPAVAAARTPVRPDNGAVARAAPIDGITVDGDLSDWPDRLERFALQQRQAGDEAADDIDFSAVFRAGYSAAAGCLFLAVEVRDQDHLLDHQLAWQEQDSHTVYVDPTHSPRGSGAMLFTVTGARRELLGVDTAWDPVVAATSWERAAVVCARRDHTTVYEWRIDLGAAVRPGRTIGLDLMVRDVDRGEGGEGGTLTSWGPIGAKSRGASRCGDLVLVDPEQPLATLRGEVGWADPAVEYDCPRRVRVTAVADPAFWLHVEADASGTYSVQVPPGRYTVSSPFIVFGHDGVLESMQTERAVQVTVAAGAEPTDAPRLGLATRERCDELLQERGVLLDWGPGSAALVDAHLDALMQQWAIPGVSVAIVSGGELVYHRASGLQNYYTGAPVTAGTLFEAASITKIVFAFAVHRLAERGVIDLDQPLHEYLPFAEIAHDPRSRQITARHCLTHCTGFPNWAWQNDDGAIDIKFDPGTAYGYSGEGFEWLGRVVAHLTGKSLTQVLHDEVQQPMGFVERTYFGDCAELRASAANGHSTTRTSAMRLPGGPGVAHSMHSEAVAMARFMIGLIEQRGLSEATYRAMLTPATALPPPGAGDDGPPWPRSFGLGFHLMDSPHGQVYGHGGDNGDFKCLFEVYREHDAGFVVFTNSSEGHLLCSALRRLLIIGRSGSGAVR